MKESTCIACGGSSIETAFTTAIAKSTS